MFVDAAFVQMLCQMPCGYDFAQARVTAWRDPEGMLFSSGYTRIHQVDKFVFVYQPVALHWVRSL